MSLIVEKTDGSTIEASFVGLNPADGVSIGEHEISLEHFSAMATHFLSGGSFGWIDNETPEAVNNALSRLFRMHEQVDEKWVRKAKYRLSF